VTAAAGDSPHYEATAEFHGLLDDLRALDRRFLEPPAGPLDPPQVVEGYKWILSILRVAADVYLWADPARPRFVDIVGPYEKWGGDNADAFYQYMPVDPARTYRVTGRRGDAVYWSLTVYGGPDDGRYSERIVGSVNDRDVVGGPAGADESFVILLSPDAPPAGIAVDAWIRLEPDAVCAITRDYLVDPVSGRRLEWAVEAVDDPEPDGLAVFRQTDADLARRLRAMRVWVQEQANIVPLPIGEANRVDTPYPVPAVTYGWAAGDAAYAMGTYALADDEALVVRGRSPDCAFWNLCLWNQFLHTYNYDYERVTINGAQIEYEDDGSWTIVVGARDPGHPNWLSTAGHGQGWLWFRWFLPDETPEQPTVEVVPVDSLARFADG
jgi:hypothetical protein